MSAADYWIELYAQAELDADDDTAAPEQDSDLGRNYYYLEDVDS
jgi:hypothetical protein